MEFLHVISLNMCHRPLSTCTVVASPALSALWQMWNVRLMLFLNKHSNDLPIDWQCICLFSCCDVVLYYFCSKALQIARQIKDRSLEAQSCYSLGNTYTLLRDFEKSIEYHIMHLRIAQELKDRLGEGRACWSIGNAYKSMGQLQKALLYAGLHMEITKEVRTSEYSNIINVSFKGWRFSEDIFAQTIIFLFPVVRNFRCSLRCLSLMDPCCCLCGRLHWTWTSA